jgi:alpha-glucosidase (family GH31 glycosyl hydrolase)
LNSQFEFDGVLISDNEATGVCNGECRDNITQSSAYNDEITNHTWWTSYPSQQKISTYDLPFIPGSTNLDYLTLSLNATHRDSNLTEYDVHSLYGHLQGMTTSKTMAAITKARPMVISRSTFAGSG